MATKEGEVIEFLRDLHDPCQKNREFFIMIYKATV
jgi:hypothetical protein